MKAVSVILIAHNEEQAIGRMLEGLLANYDQEILEIIVVDDASKDRTAEIVETWSKRNAKVIWSNEGRLVELAAHSKPVLIESTRKPSACFRILATVARCADAFGTINSIANPTLFCPRNLPKMTSSFTRSGAN